MDNPYQTSPTTQPGPASRGLQGKTPSVLRVLSENDSPRQDLRSPNSTQRSHYQRGRGRAGDLPHRSLPSKLMQYVDLTGSGRVVFASKSRDGSPANVDVTLYIRESDPSKTLCCAGEAGRDGPGYPYRGCAPRMVDDSRCRTADAHIRASATSVMRDCSPGTSHVDAPYSDVLSVGYVDFLALASLLRLWTCDTAHDASHHIFHQLSSGSCAATLWVAPQPLYVVCMSHIPWPTGALTRHLLYSVIR